MFGGPAHEEERHRSPLHMAGLAPAPRRAWARQVASARHEPGVDMGAQKTVVRDRADTARTGGATGAQEGVEYWGHG